MVNLIPYLVSVTLLDDNMQVSVLNDGPFVQYYYTDSITKIDSCVMVPLSASVMEELECNAELQSAIIDFVQQAISSTNDPSSILEEVEKTINSMMFDSLAIKQNLNALGTLIAGNMEAVRQNILKSDVVLRTLILQNNEGNSDD